MEEIQKQKTQGQYRVRLATLLQQGSAEITKARLGKAVIVKK